MANARELESSELVSEGDEMHGDAHAGDAHTEAIGQSAPPTPADAEAVEKQRARRAAFKSVEGRVIALERRAEVAAEEMDRVRDQVAQLDARLAKLEGRLEAASPNADGAPADLAQVTEHLRQLDERLQKLANALAEQSWSVPDARILK